LGRLRSGTLAAYVELLHPAPIVMVLLAATGFCFAAARGRPAAWRLRSYLAGLLATQCAISLHNDYCDRELDQRTKPWRALPRGLVSPEATLASTAALTLMGLLVVLPLGLPVVALLGIGTGAGFGYNAWFKRSRWTWLPFWVALPSLPVCAFAVVGRGAPRLGLAYIVGAPLVLGIYLADSMADLEADAGAGVQGLAHRLGPGRARLACWGALGLGQILALGSRPRTRPPGPLYLASACGLALAIAVGRRTPGRAHWLAAFLSAIGVSIAWIGDVASEAAAPAGGEGLLEGPDRLA
jgi:geranylgeranylglycerol-phosphate geranylgeranyltransferase